MPTIKENDLNQLRERLLVYKEQLLQEIHDKLIKEGSGDAVSLANKVHDKQEESLSEMLTEINLAMLSQYQHELINLERAIKRLDEGEYGTCIDCGAPIASARLQAYPTAVRCINCQAIHEQN